MKIIISIIYYQFSIYLGIYGPDPFVWIKYIRIYWAFLRSSKNLKNLWWITIFLKLVLTSHLFSSADLLIPMVPKWKELKSDNVISSFKQQQSSCIWRYIKIIQNSGPRNTWFDKIPYWILGALMLEHSYIIKPFITMVILLWPVWTPGEDCHPAQPDIFLGWLNQDRNPIPQYPSENSASSIWCH